MLGRQRSGSVVCPACGRLVGVNDERCLGCGRRNPGLWGWYPLLRKLGNDLGFEKLVVAGCAALYLLCMLADGARGGMSLLGGPSPATLVRFGASGALPVFGLGRWWTLLSAGWLHAGLLHLLFNLMWLHQLAPAVSSVYGPARMMILYTLASVTGFAASTAAGVLVFLPPFLRGGGFTVGASAGIFGLLAALVLSGRRGVGSAQGQQAWTWAIVLFAFGLIPGTRVDNWAHLGGFVGGYLTARALDPMRDERETHLLTALVCVAATAAAVAASLVAGVPPT